MTSSPARLLVADGDAPTRVGLRLALATERFEIVSEVIDAASAAEVAGAVPLDAALVASDLPGGGMEAVRLVARARPATRIVVVSVAPNDDELLRAVLAGAVGYIGRDVNPARLPFVLDGVLAGEVALPRHLTRRLLEELRGRDAHRARISERASAPLSAREWEVLHLLAQELGTGEIGRRLGVSDVTVRRHVSGLLKKLRVPDRRSAVGILRSGD